MPVRAWADDDPLPAAPRPRGDSEKFTGDDAARPLSEKGKRQSERLGRVLASSGEAPDLFITSPKVRADDTARIVAEAVGAKVVVDPRLGGALDADVVADIVAAAGPAERPSCWATTRTSRRCSGSSSARPWCRCARRLWPGWTFLADAGGPGRDPGAPATGAGAQLLADHRSAPRGDPPGRATRSALWPRLTPSPRRRATGRTGVA